MKTPRVATTPTGPPSQDESATAPPRPRGLRHNTRWLMVFLCFLGMTVNYVDRATISISLPYMTDDLHIGPEWQGVILSMFFVTYALGQLPAGALIDRYGEKKMLAIGGLIWSVVTIATGFVRGIGSLLVARLALGAGEAPAYPSCAKSVSRWFPVRERALANSVWDNGARAGTAVAAPVVTALIAWQGWRMAFWVTGAVALLWVALWLKAYREPSAAGGISAEERAYVAAGGARLEEASAEDTAEGPEDTAPEEPAVRWRDLFRYRTVWGMMIGFFCLNYVIYFFITWFPSYLVDARGFDLLKLGFYGALPGVVAIGGSLLGGWTSDTLLRRGWSVTRARKTCLVCGMLFSSVIAFAVLVPSAMWALTLLSVSYASLAFSAASVASLPADVAPTPRHVASLGGIQNFASNLAGVLGSTTTGLLLGFFNHSFVAPLMLSGALCVVGALTYGLVIKRVEPLRMSAA
ncbi:MFS transporter [Streptomyces sp. NBRC 110028]|uniref:MFS transporter n=1 Tax=Streptomyces sp. NBRC 110028 TaxID=1621260 RepID=UPI00099ECBC1|nr:MFS transporter [Streptomyces sp. NBRC 110028]